MHDTLPPLLKASMLYYKNQHTINIQQVQLKIDSNNNSLLKGEQIENYQSTTLIG